MAPPAQQSGQTDAVVVEVEPIASAPCWTPGVQCIGRCLFMPIASLLLIVLVIALAPLVLLGLGLVQLVELVRKCCCRATTNTKGASDKHWDPNLAPINPIHATAATACGRYSSEYVAMADGTRIAVDLTMPSGVPDETRIACVLHQTRYHRSADLWWPFRWLVNRGAPVDAINHEFKQQFVRSGFAVVSVDIRGSGASFGRFIAPWSENERHDACELLDWIVASEWCSGDVFLFGISYDATAAIITAAQGHPAVKAVAPLYHIGDLFRDVAAPGGAVMDSFTTKWGAITNALDTNQLSRLFCVLPIFTNGVQPVGSSCCGDTIKTALQCQGGTIKAA